MTDRQPAAAPTVFRIPADRLQRARGAQSTLLVLGILVGGGLVTLALWTLGGENTDVVFSLLFGLFGVFILATVAVTLARWRRNLRQAIGPGGVVLTVGPHGLALGGIDQLAWPDVAGIVFKDERTGEGGLYGSFAGLGRRWGERLRERGGRSELDLLVTLRDGSPRAAMLPDAARGMSSTSDDRTVIRLPFGAALPVEAFHDAYRAVEPVAAAHGVALSYDDKATV